MATKFQLITAMYEHNMKQMTAKPGEWQAFLLAAGRNYKLPFEEQVQVFVQRPEATAVLELEKWNTQFGRWVNRGATGIAVIDRQYPNKRRLKYYFDISDTNSRGGEHDSRYSRPVPLWEMKPAYETDVIETLEATFGDLEDSETLAHAVISAAKNAVTDNITDYLNDLMDCREDSFLEELDGLNVEVFFAEALQNSIAYLWLARCGIDPALFMEHEDFRHVFEFNTPDTLTVLGTATSDIAETGLREIASTVLNLQKQEKNKNRTFANEPQRNDNDNISKNERSFDHDTGNTANHLQRSERVQNTQPDPAGRAGGRAWTVRVDAPSLPSEPSQGAVFPPADERRPEPAPDGNRADSDGAVGTAIGADGEIGGRDGADESVRPAGMDTADDEHQEPGGGNDTPRPDLQLNLFPSPEEQIQRIEEAEGTAKAERPSAFSISGGVPQEYIDDELCHGSGFHEGKYRIYEHFQNSHTPDETVSFLKKEYGIGGHSPFGDSPYSVDHDGKGLHFAIGYDGNKTTLTWAKVSRRIRELVDADRYLNPKESEIYPQWFQNETERRQQIAEEAAVRAILNREPTPADTADYQYKYHLGDSVYIGSHEYEVLSFGDSTVKLFDTKFPLMNAEFSRQEFDRKIRENPMNEHLRVIAESQPEQHDPHDSLTLQEQIRNELSERGWTVSDELIDNGIMEYRAHGGRDDNVQDIGDFIENEFLSEDEPVPESEPYTPKPGDRYEIDRRLFVVDTVSEDWESVSLRDITFQEGAGFPIFRRESFEFMQMYDPIREEVAEPEPEPQPPVPVGRLDYLDSNGTVADSMEYTDEQAFVKQILEDDNYGVPFSIVVYRGGEGGGNLVNTNQFIEDINPTRSLYFENAPERTEPPLEDNQHIENIGGVEFVVTTPFSHVQKSRKRESGVNYPGEIMLVKHHIPQPEETEPTIAPAWEQKKKPVRVNYFDAFPDVPMEQRQNFKITDDDLGHGGTKAKFRANMDAINLLHDLELDGKLATPEQQDVLSRYVGWGSLPQAFDPDKADWADEFLELQTALSMEEYESARATTLNAHYTSPTVIKAIYKAIENMGFKSGNILDPGCGIGNFQGLLPDSMSDSKVYGIEIDPITGRICQQLYQTHSIAIQGYEKTPLPDSFFDLAIGNVPFGGYGVSDKKYDKHKFLVHDYFFAKTLDKVRPGGVIAFITSKGTMDKQNPAVRKYIARRAELLGAIRLPNNAFLANAGTQVTTDIIFLQKRDRIVDVEPDWVHLAKPRLYEITTNDYDQFGVMDVKSGKICDGGEGIWFENRWDAEKVLNSLQNSDPESIPVNAYFAEHPEMMLGTMAYDNMLYGNASETTLNPFPDRELSDLLDKAIANLHGEISEFERDDGEQESDNSIPADPSVRNFSYTVIPGSDGNLRTGKLYFRENSRMKPCELPATTESRIKGMIAIRDCVRTLIEYQTEDYSDYDIKAEQVKLNRLYDSFTKKYGLISSRANVSAFGSDNSFPLLGALEMLDEDGNLLRKADMFTKRTIRARTVITHVDTASEALAVSLGEKARVDVPFMCELTGMDEGALIKELEGVIFKEPTTHADDKPRYSTADEYLSGNVRAKLLFAKSLAELRPDEYAVNVKALEAVQPPDLPASEIAVRLGASWLPVEVVQRFIFELLETPRYAQWNIKVHHTTRHTDEWSIEGKSSDRSNVKAYNTYGTSRASAYKIIEETLNLRDIRIFDYVEDTQGKKTAVLNTKETMLAQAKQEQIKAAFQDWIWKDPERRNALVRIYNDKFNSTRPREYDGSHINFVGMNPSIDLRGHQVNAVAHIIYGGNTLLAYEVGAGKTFEMVAAAMEMKRLGLCHKSMIVVPNHIIEQFAAEWLQLYPSANILVSTKKDFEPKNRRKFCARIATGDYDAVIIGHSQFEKIPMSVEYQRNMIEDQLSDLLSGIAEAKRNKGGNFTVKQLEKARKSLQLRLDKLNDQSRKDDLVTFEELGVDRLFVDEAHGYKNLFLYTKMRNVGGIAQVEAQKSSDLFMKTQYLDELTGGRGTVFATGTPISNSMVELYTMQRYLQYKTLVQNGLQHFDAWASTFGETVTAIELAPEGSGYRAKTRFAKFYNLPELMNMFREVADIQTAETLHLPVPKASFHNVVIQPSEMQLEMVAGLADRAEKMRAKMVESHEDNMLCITNDGRKLALDQRLMNPMLPDHEGNKAALAAKNIYRHWENGRDEKHTQLAFCDLSTPKNDGTFNVYEDVRNKLIAKGIPPEEIAFIHDADTEPKKKELFAKVRQGKVRVLMGSTFKCGSGMNVQDKIIALHRLDCPWRPSDIAQQNGRAIRQGNNNPEVDIYTYVTEKTFDAYSYQLIENKQRFIAQVMTGKSPVRSAEDVDEQALSYAEIKALATGNPMIIEKCELEMQVGKLKLLRASHLSQRYDLEDRLLKKYPAEIKWLTERITGLERDISTAAAHPKAQGDGFVGIVLKDITYTDKKAAGTAILEACQAMTNPDPVPLGSYRGFELELSFDTFGKEYCATLKGALSHTVPLGTDIYGNITRLDNALDSFPGKQKSCEEQLAATKAQMENAKIELERPFPQEAELAEKMARLNEVNISLNLDKREIEVIADAPDEGEAEVPERKTKDRGDAR